MAQKAIQVTTENRSRLQNRLQMEATGVDMAVGYFVVMLFGADDGNYELLSPLIFNQKFNKGPDLQGGGGWFEAIPKSQPVGV